MTFARRSLGRFLLVVFCGALASGCSERDPIRRYTIERPALEHRLLGAIVAQPSQSWFFKVTGPSELVKAARPEFEEFLGSLRFEEGEPAWKLPAGWKQQAGSGMRFATLEIEAEEPLELSVIALPTPPGSDKAGYLLANINRWRGQLQQGQLTADQLESETTELEISGSTPLIATVVEFEGQLGGGPPMAAGGGGPFMGGAAGPSPRRGSSRPKLHFSKPAEWSEAERTISRGGLRIERAAAFSVEDGEKRAEVSVTSLGAAAGDRLSNINRWRRQIGLAPVAADELELTELEFAGAKGDYVELIGAEQAILGVIAVHEGAAWFTKLQGPHDLALRERERFQEFVRSIHFDH